MKILENERIKGEWKITYLDEYDNMIKEVVNKNIITDTARIQFANIFANGYTTSRSNWCIVLGTLSTTPTVSDTTMNNPISTSYKTGILSLNNNTITYTVEYDLTDCNGYVVKEAGIIEGINVFESFDPLTHYDQGYLMNHAIFDNTETKTNVKKMIITANITFT